MSVDYSVYKVICGFPIYTYVFLLYYLYVYLILLTLGILSFNCAGLFRSSCGGRASFSPPTVAGGRLPALPPSRLPSTSASLFLTRKFVDLDPSLTESLSRLIFLDGGGGSGNFDLLAPKLLLGRRPVGLFGLFSSRNLSPARLLLTNFCRLDGLFSGPKR